MSKGGIALPSTRVGAYAVGEVVNWGDEVEGLKVGDKVLVSPTVFQTREHEGLYFVEDEDIVGVEIDD